MTQHELAIETAIQLLTLFIYVYVGWAVQRREVRGNDKLALNAFAFWWYGLGALAGWGAVLTLMALAGVLTLPFYETALAALILLLIVALWALAYYLVYLYTEDPRWMARLGVFYAALWLWLTYMIAAANPIGLTIDGGNVEPQYANESAIGGQWVGALLLLLILPQVLGAIAYGSLFFKTDNRLARYRISMVAGTMLAWFGSSIASGMLQLSKRFDWWMYVSQLIGLTAALVILVAYRPPAWIQRRLEGKQGPVPAPA